MHFVQQIVLVAYDATLFVYATPSKLFCCGSTHGLCKINLTTPCKCIAWQNIINTRSYTQHAAPKNEKPYLSATPMLAHICLTQTFIMLLLLEIIFLNFISFR